MANCRNIPDDAPSAAGRARARVSWWIWLAGGLALGVASAFFAMVSLSASTAYGTEYHNLSGRQRVMARILYLGALIAALLSGLSGLALSAWSLKLLFE